MTIHTITTPVLNNLALHTLDRHRRIWAYPLGFWSASFATLGGLIYFGIILTAILIGDFTFPPPDWVQVSAGLASLLFCPIFVILMACLHTIAPIEKKSFSQISLGFSLLFAIAVSINRFTQFGAVQQGLTSGATSGIEWFLPYGAHSVMLGLEMMGWGWFLGLAMLFAAPLFSNGILQIWLRGLLVLYGILGLTSAVAFLLANPLSMVGFVAWGVVLYIITALLAIHFRQSESGPGI